MRVNPNPMPDLLAALNQTQLETQQATTRDFDRPKRERALGQSHAAAALLVENNDQATFNAGYLQSLDCGQGPVSTADSTLGSVTTALQRAISLGVEGATARSLTADRAAIAESCRASRARSSRWPTLSYQGNYMFAGTKTARRLSVGQQFDPSGVTYSGNTGVNQVSIGSGYKLAVNQPGSQLFSASGNNVFLALNNLIQAVQTNTGIGAAVEPSSAAPVTFRRSACFMATP